jgi:hypothetical protein
MGRRGRSACKWRLFAVGRSLAGHRGQRVIATRSLGDANDRGRGAIGGRRAQLKAQRRGGRTRRKLLEMWPEGGGLLLLPRGSRETTRSRASSTPTMESLP